VEQAAEQFEKAWAVFETKFKGKLLAKSKTGALGLDQVNLILKGASSDWFSGYGAEGKWLRDYANDSPDRAKAITEILKYELRLVGQVEPSNANKVGKNKTEPPPPQDEMSPALQPLKPVIDTLRALLEAFLKKPSKPAAKKNMRDTIDRYAAQLQIHKRVILDVIQSRLDS